MEITAINLVLVDEGCLRAYVNITIDNCFMVRGLKVIHGSRGVFVAMPNKRGKNGLFRDIAHPINEETRREIEGIIIAAFIQKGPEGQDTEAATQTLEDMGFSLEALKDDVLALLEEGDNKSASAA